jgi:hypothetical protein
MKRDGYEISELFTVGEYAKYCRIKKIRVRKVLRGRNDVEIDLTDACGNQKIRRRYRWPISENREKPRGKCRH